MATIEELRRQNSFGDAAAAARDSRVAQIPTDGPKAPAADGSQSNPLNTNLGRGLTNTLAALPGGAAVPGAVGAGASLAARALSASAPATTMVGRVAQGAAPYAPVLGGAVALNSGASPASAPAPSAQTAPTAAPPMPAPPSVGGSAASADAATAPALPTTSAPAPSAQPAGNEIAPGVYNHGRGQYSDNAQGMNMPAGFTGRPNPQNMAAAANLAASQQAPTVRSMAEAALSQPSGVQAPVVRNSTNDWAARNNLRNAAVSASSIENTRRWGGRGAENNPAMQEYRATLATDQALQQAQPTLAQAAMRENAGIQREGMQQQGATTRTGMQERGSMGRTMAQAALEQQKINQAGESQGFANRAAGRLEALQTAHQTAKTPEERSTLAQQIRGIQGRNDPAEWGVQVTPTTKNIDGSTSMGSIVRYNKATGQTEVVQQPGQGGGAQPSANHLAALKANPKQAAQFDEVYGPGAAARALKGG